MSRDPGKKYRTVAAFQRGLNAVPRRMPGQTLLETTGRVSGLPRRTPGPRAVRDAELTQQIRVVRERSRGTYGPRASTPVPGCCGLGCSHRGSPSLPLELVRLWCGRGA